MLYMVIFLLSELDTELPICEKKEKKLSNITPPTLVDTSRPGMKEQKRIHEGFITESLPNGMLQVRLDNEVKFEILFQEGFDTVLYMY